MDDSNKTWSEYLEQYNLSINHIPKSWVEGVFHGNGCLGVMAYEYEKEHGLGFEFGSEQVYDHREVELDELEKLFEKDMVTRKCRLPIGKMVVTTKSPVLDGNADMVLFDSKICGTMRLDKGTISWSAFVPREESVIIIEVESSGDVEYELQWKPYPAVSPRLYSHPELPYEKNPDPIIYEEEGVGVCVQPMLAGGDYTTAWKKIRLHKGKDIVIASIGYSIEESGKPFAIHAIQQAIEKGVDQVKREHSSWWHTYYKKSFLQIPDKQLEAFYWRQIYKVGCACRQDGPVMDTCGPWLKYDTGWPCVWWNLNVQLSYWIVYTSNHLELGESLTHTIDEHMDDLKSNTPEVYRHDSLFLGNPTSQDLRCGRLYTTVQNVGTKKKETSMELNCLPWICHNYWLQYRYTMDENMLRERLYPLMKGTFQLYFHLVYEGEDGKLHLPRTFSAEYGGAEDANQDLAIFRWGCKTLLYICDRLHIEDRMIPRWNDVVERLVDPPCDEHGLKIGRDVPYSVSHRHFSHLMGVFPFYLMNVDCERDRQVVKDSVNWWMTLDELLVGYSYSGAALMLEAIGDGDNALIFLKKLLNAPYVHANTMYTEAGEKQFPTIETPLTVAKALHDMVLQSWGDKIRIFPAVPNQWRDVLFQDFRAEGAFLVSAQRKDGKTIWVKIKSLAGEPCVVEIDGECKEIILEKGEEISLEL